VDRDGPGRNGKVIHDLAPDALFEAQRWSYVHGPNATGPEASPNDWFKLDSSWGYVWTANDQASLCPYTEIKVH
jgi:hypothetical protein